MVYDAEVQVYGCQHMILFLIYRTTTVPAISLCPQVSNRRPLGPRAQLLVCFPCFLPPNSILLPPARFQAPRRGRMRAPQVPEECPEEVVALINECTSVASSARPSARELVDRLLALGKHGPG